MDALFGKAMEEEEAKSKRRLEESGEDTPEGPEEAYGRGPAGDT